MKKRSNAPIFWALFGAGGMLAALTGPALVLALGLTIPFGMLLPSVALDYRHMLAFMQHPLAKLVVLAVIALYMWHAAHRIYKSLHDVGIHPGPVPKAICYGSALLATIVALNALIGIGS